MKLFTFGCSMTDYEGIKERLSELLDVELINSAQSAGSNQLQVKRFHQLILENQISSDDIIYWQVTFSHRRFKRLMKHHLPVIEEIQLNSFTHEGVHFKTSKNIFDGEIRIDLMSNSPWLEDNLDEIDVDYNDELQSLLATIILAKKVTNKMIVVFGWDEVVPSEYIGDFKEFLTTHKIDFIDESYLSFVIRNNLKFSDYVYPNHPTKDSAVFFAENVVYPRLKQILNNEN